ncbi:MAG: response regulator transcription factor [Phycisphaerae bacterium]
MAREDHKKGVTRVVIVDDHPIVRQGIKMLADQEPDMEVCGEAEDAADALRVIERTNPDVAIVDLTLKDSFGLQLIKDIRRDCPRTRVLVLSMRDESLYAERALRAGARGYITKEEGPAKVIEGIRRVLAGEVYVSAKMASKVLSRFAEGGEPGQSPVETLTDREMEVFRMIGQGLPAREIAEKLHVSVKTVDSHREHIKEKLGVGSASELLRHAVQWFQGAEPQQ